jgi:hypothetical protein
MTAEQKTLNWAGRVARLVAVRAVNSVLHPLECVSLANRESQTKHSPIFIIGAPRSGSTVLYQTLVHCLDVGYFSNLHALFYGMPTLVERCYDARGHLKQQDYTSHLGQTRGWHAPSECGEFWYRFYRREFTHEADDMISAGSLKRLAQIVARMASIRGRTLLIKNLNCGLRLASLARAFPEALYLVVHRDEVEIGHSLLTARIERFGRYDAWFSVKPAGGDELQRLPPHEQVIEQVRSIYGFIDCERMRIGRDRFLDIDYDQFCDNPNRTVECVHQFAEAHDVRLTRTSPGPSEFARSNRMRIDVDMYDRMETYARAS